MGEFTNSKPSSFRKDNSSINNPSQNPWNNITFQPGRRHTYEKIRGEILGALSTHRALPRPTHQIAADKLITCWGDEGAALTKDSIEVLATGRLVDGKHEFITPIDIELSDGSRRPAGTVLICYAATKIKLSRSAKAK